MPVKIAQMDKMPVKIAQMDKFCKNCTGGQNAGRFWDRVVKMPIYEFFFN